ncbi:zinc-binding dehydrogenase [candidate division KSB1 bacterium]|nr:zinc-binding dehydrogenase [candidate division KSB1 bacterium]
MRDIGIEYVAPGKMQFYDLGSPPALKSTEILIRTSFSGITNGTERHSLMGEHGWKGVFPSRNGYQHVGKIEKVGEEVQGFKPGDWVFYGRYVGHRGWHIQDVANANPFMNDSHLCFLLPATANYKLCALMGVAGVSVRGVRRCRIGPAQNVWVAGAGVIGQFAAQAARAAGARVIVSDINPKRLAVAEDLGAHRTIQVEKTTYNSAIQAEGPFDCIIDACGVNSLMLDIFEGNLLAHGGVISCQAVRTNTTFYWGLLHSKEASIEVSCHFGLDDLRVLMHFITNGIIRINPLISHIESIENAPGIYELLRDKPEELLGVIFDWNR